MNKNFSQICDIQTGALALLTDTVSKLNTSGVNYMIIGGWCPYLRCKGNHPGTKDVDVLFADADKKFFLENVIKVFLNDGYLTSAKHDFQLLKPLKIDTKEFVFNIDLLHPAMTKENPELFVDHFVMDISDNQEYEKMKKIMSIVLPSSRALFEKHFYNIVTVEGVDYGGNKKQIEIPLLDEEGLMISKVGSVQSIKRTRDAFDIYLIISKCQSNWDKLKEVIKKDTCGVRILFEKLAEYLSSREGKEAFDANVKKIYQNIGQECKGESPHAVVRDKINSLL